MKRSSLSKKLVATALIAGVFVSVGAVSYAGNSYSNYSTTVSRFNGSGYTTGQTKARSNVAGNLNSISVGGNYLVDVRMQKTDGSSSGRWVRDVDDATTYTVPNSLPAQHRVRLQFSNDLLTPVDVQVTGKWRSN